MSQLWVAGAHRAPLHCGCTANKLHQPVFATPMASILHRYGPTWAIQWLVMMALWFAFVSTVEFWEFILGIAAAAAAATGDAVIRRSRFVKFRPEPRWLLEF